ncbi:glycosyltransferase family A protein [uncultured Roseobacter sp.]|uniref:glycosyltransferase family 2 protein n=1 Tax=uncultured Roseobacter sp. TaxID=114847 RepID=UPI0026075774|nr:glycosyltransferase family A protein [uncultured Roseobacter sp.]
MPKGDSLVTVVVPAYNAEATLDMTLDSVRNQTHRKLEIIVVVDGATDDTEAVARRHAREDARIKVMVTPNRGLVPTRNTGARAGSGEFIAPVDADDVWHHEKIEKQLAVFDEGGPEMGLVYTLFRRIDTWCYLIRDGAYTCWSGRIFGPSLLYNCVGNGSSILIRRSAFEQVGGYNTDLNRLGCEDYLLQVLISHDWTIGVVPEYLTGYRYDDASMSRNHLRMAQARLKMLEIVALRHPDVQGDLMRLAQSQAIAELAIAQARHGKLVRAVSAFVRAGQINTMSTASYAVYRIRDFSYRFVRNAGTRLRREKPPKFQHLNPRVRYSIQFNPRRSRTMRRLLRQSNLPTEL